MRATPRTLQRCRNSSCRSYRRDGDSRHEAGAWRAALAIFTLAAVAALLSSGWNNRQLLQRVGVDIARYERIAMDDYRPKASAVRVLREDAALLDSRARNGVPLRLSLGLYRGEQIRLPLLEAIRGYVPPPPPPRPVQRVAPNVIRLDSMSLFDTGKWVLKPGSTKRLVNSLMDIKARPGWLIVVAGHTDSVGEEKSQPAIVAETCGIGPRLDARYRRRAGQLLCRSGAMAKADQLQQTIRRRAVR